MNRDLLSELAKLKRLHGTEFDNTIRLLASDELTMPSPHGRGRKKVYNASTLEFVWVLVEVKRKLKKLSIARACDVIAEKGGFYIEEIEQEKEIRRDINKGGTIRSVYYKAKTLLDHNPALRNEWEYMLELRLESHRSNISIIDIILKRFPAHTPEQTPSLRKLLRK